MMKRLLEQVNRSCPIALCLGAGLMLATLNAPMATAGSYDKATLEKALLKLHQQYEQSLQENARLKASVQRQQQQRPQSFSALNDAPPSGELQALKNELAKAQQEKANAQRNAEKALQWQTEAQSLRQQLDQLKAVLEASETKQQNLEAQLRTAMQQRQAMPGNAPGVQAADDEINMLKSRIATLKAENNTMREQLKEGAGITPAAMQNRLELATTELKKALQTITDQQNQINTLGERIEALQSLQMNETVTLTGFDVKPKNRENTLALTARPEAKASTDITQLVEQASQQRKLGDFTKAEATLKQALALSPNEATLYYNLGNVYADAERLGEARKAYEQALQKDASLAKAYYNLGVVEMRMNKATEAKTHLKRYLSLAPQAPQADEVKQLIQQL